ncbi:MAG: hypothetical protein DID89_2727548623 [Candidatus Nitrotoga sp. CP45]|nr:MAG: hypothetical protein DID89_2727548623 [Candidatus Nitrotoga sp. CP45]
MTTLNQSPFYLLGATTRDDRRRIVELAEEKSLTLDGDVCTKARSDLTTPRNRLAVEMAWLPGLSPNSAKVLVDNLHNHIDLVKMATTAPALAKANLLAAAIELLDPEMEVDQWCDRIVEFAYTVDMIESKDVLREINEDRSVSGFPVVKLEHIEAELLERQRYYTDTIKTALNRFSPDKLIDVVTRVVETTTDTGEEHGASLVHDLVERYEADANRDYLQPEAENIKKLAEAIRQSAHKGESSVKPLVDKLIQVVSKWDSVAQPIQLSVKARGLDHGLSYEVAHAIRNLGLDLFNKHDMLDTVNRLTKVLQELFAELPEMVERLDQDAETLDEIHGNRNEAQERSNEWAKEIYYQAELGLVFKDTLRISTKGVEWKNKCFPLDSITWVKWGAVNHSLNGVPTGTDYTIAVGDNRSSAVIETRKNEIYSTFTDKLWRAVCTRLLTETLITLKNGKSISIGGTVIDDNGVQLTKHKFFGNETEYRDWGKVTYASSGGSLFITAQDDKKVYVSLPYLTTPNAHILEAMIRLSFKKWTGRLSGLLNE